MDAPNVNEAPRRSLRRRLDELAETQRWVHHVADLGSGEVLTTPLDRPLTPLSRVERLSRLGHAFDSSIFGAPRIRLTSRRPYQASPEAYLVAWNPEVYLPFDDTVTWELPRDYQRPPPLLGMDFFFVDAPRGLPTLSISMSGKAWPGMLGHVLVVTQNLISVQIPIGDSFAAHTVDLVVPTGALQAWDVSMLIEAGVELLTFRSISFGSTPLVVDPGLLVS